MVLDQTNDREYAKTVKIKQVTEVCEPACGVLAVVNKQYYERGSAETFTWSPVVRLGSRWSGPGPGRAGKVISMTSFRFEI